MTFLQKLLAHRAGFKKFKEKRKEEEKSWIFKFGGEGAAKILIFFFFEKPYSLAALVFDNLKKNKVQNENEQINKYVDNEANEQTRETKKWKF